MPVSTNHYAKGVLSTPMPNNNISPMTANNAKTINANKEVLPMNANNAKTINANKEVLPMNANNNQINVPTGEILDEVMHLNEMASRLDASQRGAKASKLIHNGAFLTEVATFFGLSESTVYDDLAKYYSRSGGISSTQRQKLLDIEKENRNNASLERVTKVENLYAKQTIAKNFLKWKNSETDALKKAQERIKAKEEAEAKAAAEARAKAEAEAKARAEAIARAKAEAEARAQAEKEAKAKAEAEARAQAEKEAKAKAEAEAKAQAEKEAKAKAEAEAKAQEVKIPVAERKTVHLIDSSFIQDRLPEYLALIKDNEVAVPAFVERDMQKAMKRNNFAAKQYFAHLENVVILVSDESCLYTEATPDVAIHTRGMVTYAVELEVVGMNPIIHTNSTAVEEFALAQKNEHITVDRR